MGMREYERRGGRGRTIVAFTLGAAIGSAIALLFAPASGQATRRRIAMRLRNAQRTVGRRLDQTRRKLLLKAEHARAAATDWVAQHVSNGNGRRHRPVHHV